MGCVNTGSVGHSSLVSAIGALFTGKRSLVLAGLAQQRIHRNVHIKCACVCVCTRGEGVRKNESGWWMGEIGEL